MAKAKGPGAGRPRENSRPHRTPGVLDAAQKIKAILRALPPEEKEEAEFVLFSTRGFFDRWRERLAAYHAKANRQEFKLRMRNLAKNNKRDITLSIEKESKTLPEMKEAHPEIEYEAMRSAIRNGNTLRGLTVKSKKSHVKS